MKILLSTVAFKPSFGFGGAPRVAYDIAKELAKRKHEVVVYTSDAKDAFSRLNVKRQDKVDGIEVYYFKNLTFASIRASKLFITPDIISAAKHNLKDFDIIHLHEFRSFQNVIIHHYASKYGVPYVLQAHGEVLPHHKKQKMKKFFDSFFGYRLLNDASKVIALNQVEFSQYCQMKVPRDKIEIIPNGIDTVFDSLPPKGEFKRKFRIDSDKKMILFIGRLHYQKGVDILIKAYAQLRNNLKNCVLVIAGPDDGYLEETKSLIKKANLKNEVLITGPIINPCKFSAFVDADVCVIPSRYEGFPMIALETLAYGKPVIASRIPPHEAILKPIGGILFEPGNSKELATCLADVLTDDEEAAKIGLRGQAFVKNNYSIEKITDQFENLYKNISKTA